jgi:hypothetical protein
MPRAMDASVDFSMSASSPTRPNRLLVLARRRQ